MPDGDLLQEHEVDLGPVRLEAHRSPVAPFIPRFAEAPINPHQIHLGPLRPEAASRRSALRRDHASQSGPRLKRVREVYGTRVQ